MKKLLKTVAVLLAAALAVGSLASCKTNAEIGDNTINWKKQEKIDDAKFAKKVVFEIKGADINWFTWANKNGQILNPQPGKTVDTAKKTVTFDFSSILPSSKKSEEYTLNIHAVGNKDNDFRGDVTVRSDKGTKIMSDQYSQLVPIQCAFYFTNDEPLNKNSEGKGGSYFLQDSNTYGDYTVQEVWVLEKVGEKEYRATDKLKYKNLDMKFGETKGYLIPAGKPVVVATRQPDRAKLAKDSGTHKKGDYAETWLEWRDADKDGVEGKDGKISKAQREKKEDEFWGQAVNFSDEDFGNDAHIHTDGNPRKNSISINAHEESAKEGASVPKTNGFLNFMFTKKTLSSNFEPKSVTGVEYIELQPGVPGQK